MKNFWTDKALPMIDRAKAYLQSITKTTVDLPYDATAFHKHYEDVYIAVYEFLVREGAEYTYINRISLMRSGPTMLKGEITDSKIEWDIDLRPWYNVNDYGGMYHYVKSIKNARDPIAKMLWEAETKIIEEHKGPKPWGFPVRCEITITVGSPNA